MPPITGRERLPGYRLGRFDSVELFAVVYSEYQYRLAQANAVDFDGLIMRTVELFRTCPESGDYYRHKFRYFRGRVSGHQSHGGA